MSYPGYVYVPYPKWITNPETKEALIVDDEEAHDRQLRDWGLGGLPGFKLPTPLSDAQVDAGPAPEATETVRIDGRKRKSATKSESDK